MTNTIELLKESILCLISYTKLIVLVIVQVAALPCVYTIQVL